MAGKAKILRSLIIGAPGSGKTTLASHIVRDFNLAQLTSGGLLREQVASGTEAGQLLQKQLDAGQQIQDDVIVGLMASQLQKMKEMKASWLLNGFPRNLEQAEALHSKIGESLDLVINVDVPFETVQARLASRWVHAPSGRVYNLLWDPPKTPGVDDVTGEPLTQREVDLPDNVIKRVKNYNDRTMPLLDHYDNLGVLHSFAGTDSDVMYPDIRRYLDGFIRHML